jgi:hypothetical protein
VGGVVQGDSLDRKAGRVGDCSDGWIAAFDCRPAQVKAAFRLARFGDGACVLFESKPRRL